jgi:hypothetical protein
MGYAKKEKAKARKLKKQQELKGQMNEDGTMKEVPYTKEERERKISRIMIQLSQTKWEHLVPERAKEGMFKFIETGESYIDSVELPSLSRTLTFHFVNDKTKEKENSLNFIFNKVRVDDEEDNPINELNKIQEHMM